MTLFKKRSTTISDNGELLGGYPGLKFTALRIAEYIPNCKLYIEPFAGLGSVSRHVKSDKKILNDKSDFAINYLKTHFSAKITKDDFETCMLAYNYDYSFFLIDPPWRFTIYENKKDPFCDRKPEAYYKKILELLPIIKGDWILCSSIDEHEHRGLLRKTEYYKKEIHSARKKIFGYSSKVLLLSNKPFIRHKQQVLACY